MVKTFPARVQFAWNRLPVGLRVFGFGVLCAALGLGTAALVIRGPIQSLREDLAVFFARVIQSDISRRNKKEDSILRRLDSVAKRNGLEMWIVNENGSIVSSTHQKLLPLPLSTFRLPREEFEAAWSPEAPLSDKYVAIRLLSQPSEYAVFLFSQEGSPATVIQRTFGLFLLLFLLGISLYAQKIARPGVVPQ